jgi:hypothetical protein
MSRGLRIGVVLHGQLVEERVVRTGPVSLGQSLRATISVPVDGVPREHVLFGPTLALHLPQGMTGRVAVGETVADAVDGPIARGARGKLVLGDLTLLFQDVAAPVVAPRPRLPASMRGFKIDRRLAVIVGASLVAHVAIAAWAWNRDIEGPQSFGERAAMQYQPDFIDVQLPDHVERVDPTTNATKPAVATPITPTHSIVPAHTPSHAAATDPAQLALDAQRMATILTGDDGAHGFGAMSHRQPGADLGTQIADARDHHVTIGDGTPTSRVDDRARIGTDPDRHLQTSDPTYVTAPHHAEERNTRIQLVAGSGDRTSTLTPEDVLGKIQGVYMVGLQRCYRLAIGQDAGLQGKVALELTVDSHGRVTDPAATGIADKLDQCITGQMAAWHFTAPRDKAGEPTDASFKISLVLRTGG